MRLRHRVDSSSCRSFIDQAGLGRPKHIDLEYLWIQDQRSRNIFDLKPTPTNFCPPDLATKAMSSVPAKMLSFTAGLCLVLGSFLNKKNSKRTWRMSS